MVASMKKKVSATRFFYLCAAFFLAIATPCLASVTGTVTDTTGSPVSGALVTFTDESNADNKFSAYTNEDGTYSISLTPVSVKEETPATFQLQQNYPNPFNPSTTIPFSLNEAGFVNLSVYNITGQKVRTLVESYHSVGSYIVTWNGLDVSGKSAAAGIYIYQLKCGDAVESRKMLLLDGGSSGGFSGSNQTATRAKVMAKFVSDATIKTFLLTITGYDIETYEESGVTVVDGESYDFVVVRKPFDIRIFTFVSIHDGSFRMGDIQNYGQNSQEKPVHDVTISSFEMSIYEITQGQYQMVMGSNPSKNYKVGENYPVEMVSWYDAVKFCNKLSDAAGLERCHNESSWSCDFSKNGFRLPTEAEWEYACRAGTETKFYTGNNLSSDARTSTDLDVAGWYDGNSGNKTHSVGGKEPNSFGLYDMHGNVWEWCNDWYGDNYYSSSPSINPTGPSFYGLYRVIRGGGWGSYAGYCRSAYRDRNGPAYTSYRMGFRVVRRPYPQI